VKAMDLPSSTVSASVAPDRRVPAVVAIVAVVATLVAIALMHGQSAVELYRTWMDSPTYNHCLLVLPVGAWFLWRLRSSLARTTFTPWPVALVLVAGASAIWLAGALTDIKSLRDLALVLFVPAVLVTLLGRRFAGIALFPLVFMLFAWPFGEIFVPTMMGWTADFTVAALRASGVPVFREGNNFVIPSGEWSVVEECSGIRYLMASLSAGAFYAYVNFRSYLRRAIFIGLALLVPLIANWFRAYLTVLLGHFSNNALAVGFDHLVYGWVFFGIVMFGLFFIGSRMIDDDPTEEQSAPGPASSGGSPVFARAIVPVAMLTVAVAAIGPVWAAWGTANMTRPFAQGAESPVPPAHIGEWHRERIDSLDQGPLFPTGMASASARYRSNAGVAGMHVAAGWGTDARNTVFSYNTTARLGGNRRWYVVEERQVAISPDANVKVIERRMSDSVRRLLVWQWYQVGSVVTSDLLAATLAVAKSRLRGEEDAGVVITLYAEYTEDVAGARERLSAFRAAAGPTFQSWIQP
jgi:exosortase A